MPALQPRPYDYPVGSTARRPLWTQLPDDVRAGIERRCGATVRTARSAGSGFTAGFASTLVLDDGSSVFVKAATRTGDPFADHAIEGYRAEVPWLRALPPEVPAPRLRWAAQVSDWYALCLDAVPGRAPHRPWDRAELERALDAQEQAAGALTPAPDEPPSRRLVDDLADEPLCWSRLSDEPLLRQHAAQAAELAVDGVTATGGDTLLHADLRDDNVILDGDDVWICDWNWPVRGAAWFDTVTLLVSAAGDGLDTDAILARRSLTRAVAPTSVDGVLALLAGFWLDRSRHDRPASSPWIRRHQRWHGLTTWDWLCRRRGWR